MISVCLATYNGATYLREQVDSILPQLGNGDELVISDDGSTDETLQILVAYKDERIKIFHNKGRHGFIGNFENALRHSKGDYIFLSDQDDIWIPGKVEKCVTMLEKYVAINHNSLLVNQKGEPTGNDFFTLHKSKGGYWQTLIRNSYSGCCMAFRRELLNSALPFPSQIASHDIWIGLLAEKHGKTLFYNEPLLFYRRHDSNASSTSEKSKMSFLDQLKYRIYFFLHSLTR